MASIIDSSFKPKNPFHGMASSDAGSSGFFRYSKMAMSAILPVIVASVANRFPFALKDKNDAPIMMTISASGQFAIARAML